MIEFVLAGIALFFFVWLIFINIMPSVKEYKSLSGKEKAKLLIPFVIGYLGDAVFNIVYGTVLFLEPPREVLFTKRLIRMLNTKDEDSYKFKLAMFICKRLLEPYDPNHCGLDRFK